MQTIVMFYEAAYFYSNGESATGSVIINNNSEELSN